MSEHTISTARPKPTPTHILNVERPPLSIAERNLAEAQATLDAAWRAVRKSVGGMTNKALRQRLHNAQTAHDEAKAAYRAERAKIMASMAPFVQKRRP